MMHVSIKSFFFRGCSSCSLSFTVRWRMLQFMWRSPWSLSKERLGDDKPRFDWPGLLVIDIVLECFMMVPNELICFELGSEISNDWIFSLYVSTFCKIAEWYVTLTSSAKEKVSSRRLKTKKEKEATFIGSLEVNKVAGNFHFALGKSFHQSNVHLHELLAFQNNVYNVYSFPT